MADGTAVPADDQGNAIPICAEPNCADHAEPRCVKHAVIFYILTHGKAWAMKKAMEWMAQADAANRGQP